MLGGHRTHGPTAPTTTSAAGRRCWRSARGSARSCARAGGRTARSSSPAGTARSTACSARPSGPSSTSATLHANAVAYLNMDIIAGQEFGAGGVAGARQADHRRHQDGAASRAAGSVYDSVARRQARRRRSTAWAAARTTPCSLDHLGVPVDGGRATRARAASTTPPTTTPTSSSTSSIPATSATRRRRETLGVTALRLANADALPLRYSDYADRGGRLRRRAAGGPAATRRRAGRPDAAARGGAGVGRGDERRWRRARRRCSSRRHDRRGRALRDGSTRR